MGCEAGRCKTSIPQGIFIVTPSLEGWSTKAIQAYSCPIQTYSAIYCIFRILCNFYIFRTLPYLKFQHMQKLRYIQNSVKAYSGISRVLCNASILRTLSYLQLCYFQNFDVFRTQAYSKSCLSRHIQMYSGMLTLFLILHLFQQILEPPALAARVL